MSNFKCEVIEIDDVFDHPNADRLTIVKIGGYECISNKHDDGSWRYNKGDLVVYIPEGAVIPEDILKKMGFWNEDKQKGILSGGKGNRVKAMKLRGTFSQGILYPVYKESETCAKITLPSGNQHYTTVGDCVAEVLGIEKYEPVIPQKMKGVLTGGLFGYTKSYDIENIQKYQDAFEEDEMIVAHEKLHGTLFQCGILSDCPENVKHTIFQIDNHDCHAYVTSKGLAKKGIIQQNTDINQDNLYVSAYNTSIKDKIDFIITRFKELNGLIDCDKEWRLYIFGEVFGTGVQDLHYGTIEPELRIFDVFIRIFDSEGNIEKEGFLSATKLKNWCIACELKQVPLLYSGPFKGIEDLESVRDGKTIAGNGSHIREGIVIRPQIEREYHGLPANRLQLKMVSPKYLLRKGDTTEYA